jgi:hypothetical protein
VVLVSAGSLTAAAGAVFALATLGGYLLSLWTGLFGFTEVRTTAGAIEVAAFAALAGLAALPARRGRAGNGPLARLRAGAPGTGRVISASVAPQPWRRWRSSALRLRRQARRRRPPRAAR